MVDTVREAVAKLETATDPACQLGALAELETAAGTARVALAVSLALDDGWTYAQIGRALAITRQAASKQYGPAVTAEMRLRARRQREER